MNFYPQYFEIVLIVSLVILVTEQNMRLNTIKGQYTNASFAVKLSYVYALVEQTVNQIYRV